MSTNMDTDQVTLAEALQALIAALKAEEAGSSARIEAATIRLLSQPGHFPDRWEVGVQLTGDPRVAGELATQELPEGAERRVMDRGNLVYTFPI
jgi:hypothetical protein